MPDCTTLSYANQSFSLFSPKTAVLYTILKILSRLAMMIWCRKLVINKPALLKISGPVLLASNHPNSFLDSVILDTLFREPVWSLARGDVFKKPLYIGLFTKLRILPVYRTSEGVENLSENYKTFDSCIDIFRKNGIITIFSEGKCINEWHLRPLKKGTARLAMKAWEENIPLKVLPVGINYNSFRLFGKNVILNFGEVLLKEHFNMNEPDGLRHQAFNNRLNEELKQLIFEIQQTDKKKKKDLLTVRISPLKKILLALPALAGFITHVILFYPIKKFTGIRTLDTDHYDSVIIAILLVAYPLYLILLTAIALVIFKSWYVAFILLVLPFTAWSFIQLKSQIDK
ncbi:MAG: 1-acyl-sn-glycerol-3-phosphate acyltransferase [Sphingobacteriales bacterium]|nr:1-acyl-sn-glycerol-3-phosphate acyltransferase [Sphingobacteriales bacterium]